MTRAALYLRISQDQSGEALGVTRQREDCQALADQAGWNVVEVYVDNDISAYKDRPAYNKMLEAMRSGELDAVVAWAPDRIYRRIKDLETLIEIIESHNIEIRTVRAGELDLTGAYGRMLARILGAIAAGEGEIKSERWKRSWRQRREAGDFAKNGRRNFGYTKDGDVIPEEAEVAQWMANKILTGTSLGQLARELYALELCTSYGNPWSVISIKRFLTNPRIAGWSTTSRKEKVGTDDKNKPIYRRHVDIISEGKWEPLIDRETYEGVKAILSTTRPYVPRKALLNGLVFCSCETRMITGGYNSKPSGEYKRVYRCNNRPGVDGCGKVSTLSSHVEEMVEAYARARLNDPRVRQAIGAQREDGSQDGGPYAELAAIEMRLIELEKSLDDPGLSLDAILRALERTRERQTELQRAIAVRHQAVIPESDADWPEDLEHRRGLVDLVVERVTIKPATRASRLGFDSERVQIDPREL